MIIIGAILKYLSVNCAESSAPVKSYSRHPGSLYRIYRKLDYSNSALSTKNKRKPQPYDAPDRLGIKWTLDMFQQHAILALCLKSSTGIPSLMKPPENVLYPLIWWNKAVTQW